MKRKFFRFLLSLIPDKDGFWYRLREKTSRVQAWCPKCKALETAIGNKHCSDCVMNKILEDYRRDHNNTYDYNTQVRPESSERQNEEPH